MQNKRIFMYPANYFYKVIKNRLLANITYDKISK